MASMRAAMASAILCIHRNRNTVWHRLAAHRSSLGAALGLMIVGCVLVGNTYGCSLGVVGCMASMRAQQPW